ncbi:hypothetical protein AB4Z54_01500 [Streptomyces sp. MCAF7]
MRYDRRALRRVLRTFLSDVDRLHPAALLVLVPVLVGLAYITAPSLVSLFAALVGAIKAGTFLAGAALIGRLAVRTAATFRRASADPAP